MSDIIQAEDKIKLKAESGKQGRLDGIAYEEAVSDFLLSEHISNSPNSILNVLCRKKNGASFGNSAIECLDMSTDRNLLSAKTRRKTTSKIDLSILCKQINQCINFSIKKNATGFQFHITTANRFFEIIEQKEFFNTYSNINLINGFNKFLGVPGFTPEEMKKNGTLSKTDFEKIKQDSRFSFSELPKKEQTVIKDFFSDDNNVLNLVMIFLFGYYSEEIEAVDYILYNKTNFNENSRMVDPDFIFGKDLISYVKLQLLNKENFIAFNDTTIHFGEIFSIQRKGSGKNASERSGIQFKGKNLHKLNQAIALAKISNPEFFDNKIELSLAKAEPVKDILSQDFQHTDNEIIVHEILDEPSIVETDKVIADHKAISESNDLSLKDIEDAESSDSVFVQVKLKTISFKNRFIKGCKAFWQAFNE